MKLFKTVLNTDSVTEPYNVRQIKLFQSEVTFKFKQNTSVQNGEDFKCIRNGVITMQHTNPCRNFDKNTAKQNKTMDFIY
jgi:hypothetical protein